MRELDRQLAEAQAEWENDAELTRQVGTMHNVGLPGRSMLSVPDLLLHSPVTYSAVFYHAVLSHHESLHFSTLLMPLTRVGRCTHRRESVPWFGCTPCRSWSSRGSIAICIKFVNPYCALFGRAGEYTCGYTLPVHPGPLTIE